MTGSYLMIEKLEKWTVSENKIKWDKSLRE